MIKLGQVLHVCVVDEITDKNGNYRPRLVRKVWVVCKVGKTKGNITPVSVSDGVKIKKETHRGVNQWFKGYKPNELIGGYYKSEIAAVRSLIEKKNPYKDSRYNPEWAAEWDKDQAMIKRAIVKLKTGK
ncbi:hypothetical protein NVP1055O_54 [Vibrio phage 1.055.O._10N.286.55.E9]|nr:hypothetical protein NVP1055O_54 [Vibrio phage 1.055.O._10N.286.55.E9]